MVKAESVFGRSNLMNNAANKEVDDSVLKIMRRNTSNRNHSLLKKLKRLTIQICCRVFYKKDLKTGILCVCVLNVKLLSF